ncbi:MAG TPA: hypothetical protein VLV15_06770, partial [Dongiaceae bacterium]|nr:hypothetical protein [Dongiaceae bacterium]
VSTPTRPARTRDGTAAERPEFIGRRVVPGLLPEPRDREVAGLPARFGRESSARLRGGPLP